MSTYMRRSLPVVLVLALVAVLVPFLQRAEANHGSRTLEVTPEENSLEPGQTQTLVAQISAEPTHSSGAVNIDFELEDGANDGNDGDTPEFPDKTCSIGVGATECQVSYTGHNAGEDQWRVWIDHDGNNSTVEADPLEGPDESMEPGEPQPPLLSTCSGAGQPDGEPDCTDVVVITWTGLLFPASVDCDDSGGPDTERETKRSGGGSSSNETYTCEVFDQNGNPLVDRDPETSGDQTTTIYAENEGGPNDEDNVTDYSNPDNECSTTPAAFPTRPSGDNNCTMTFTQAEVQEGTATICFWAQGENDATPAAAGAAHCANEEIGENQKANGSDAANDLADRTSLTWEQAQATGIDVETEQESLTLGTERQLTATVYDQFGNQFGASDTTVNFEFFRGSPTDETHEGGDANTPASVDESCATGNGPSCNITYTQDSTAGRDLICAWIGTNPGMSGSSRNASGKCAGEGRNDADDEAGTADAPEPVGDRIDLVETTWLNDPAATELDCKPEWSKGLRKSRHRVTCTATSTEPEGPVANTEVDVEFTGTNQKDGNTPESPDATCTTNANGKCFFTHGPGGATNKAGRTTYRAWIDADYEDGTVEADATEGIKESDDPGDTEEPDNTDVVSRRWLSGQRDVSLQRSRARVDQGSQVRLFGQITAEATSCEKNQTVRLKRRAVGTKKWDNIRTGTSGANSKFSFKVNVGQDSDFKVRVTKDGACPPEWSPKVRVRTK